MERFIYEVLQISGVVFLINDKEGLYENRRGMFINKRRYSFIEFL